MMNSIYTLCQRLPIDLMKTVILTMKIDLKRMEMDRERGEGDSNSRGETPPVFKTGAVVQA